MSISQVEFTKFLNDDQVYDHMMDNYDVLGKDWIAHQWNWMNSIYAPFKDHYKYLILISLTEKTLQFYDQVDVTYSFDQFYSKSFLPIEKFSITELCEKLKLPKETMRRKVLELENFGVLKRNKKGIIIDRLAFNFIKPVNQIKLTSKYVFLIYEILYKNKVLSKKLDSKTIENIIKKNFTLCWRWYFRMQIPLIIGYDGYFRDVATSHIWATTVMNHAFNYSKSFDKNNIHELKSNYVRYNQGLLELDESNHGVSAMSISEMTNIPRATVIRKCKFLIKNKYLSLNSKKQYVLTGLNLGKLVAYQKKFFKHKAKFLRKILNLCLI